MRLKIWVGLGVLLVLVLMLGTGCVKKEVCPEPGEASMMEKKDQEAMRERSMQEQAAAKRAMQRAENELQVNRIYFDFDKYDLKSESKTVLKGKAGILKKYKGWKMLIEGHCDERGTEEYNLALGERRARAAYEFLVILGVESSRLKIVSFGEERPANSGHSETAWAKNRRDEFKVFK